MAITGATLVALAAPAAASAASVSVENGAIRYVGDADDNELDVFPAHDGEQELWVRFGTTLGPGCRSYEGSTQSPPGNTLCTRDGVDRIEFIGGDGRDRFTTGSIYSLDLPLHADMGAGDDWWDFGSVGSDVIDMGPGNDIAVDALGDDRIDAGPGDDVVYGLDGYTGNDTIIGGDGNDNLDGKDGNDTIDAGPGNDLTQGSPGDDTVDGGDGDDLLAGIEPNTASCSEDPGNDRMDGGPGNDQICGGTGVDMLDGGAGDDAVSSLDGTIDGPVSCGDGQDVVWSDVLDPVAIDCERQAQPRIITLPAGDVLPVTLPCASGACTGTVSAFAAPEAAQPLPGVPPSRAPTKLSGKALARAKFKLRAKTRRTVRLRLDRRSAKRLKRLGTTTIEARTTFTQGGRRYVVRRAFQVQPRR